MRRIREILRLHFDCKLSNCQIASALKISKGSVANTLTRFHASELSWPLDASLSDSQIEQRFYKRRRQMVLTPDRTTSWSMLNCGDRMSPCNCCSMSTRLSAIKPKPGELLSWVS